MATFLKTKGVAGEDTVAVPCRTMTLQPIPSHTEQTRWPESTIASHLATHEQLPSVHRDQVADKLFSGYVSVTWTLLAAAGT